MSPVPVQHPQLATDTPEAEGFVMVPGVSEEATDESASIEEPQAELKAAKKRGRPKSSKR